MPDAAAVLGPQRTLACYEEWTNVLIRPGLGKGEDPARAKELLEATATDSQSFVILFHNFQNPERDTRPLQPAPELRAAHWLLGGALTIVTLMAIRNCKRRVMNGCRPLLNGDH